MHVVSFIVISGGRCIIRSGSQADHGAASPAGGTGAPANGSFSSFLLIISVVHLFLLRIFASMLQVGLIGLGPEWEQRFRPALERLSKRLQVRCVYATAASHAEQAAAELKCDVAPGLVALIEREDVRALLLLETDWHQDVPAWLACRFGKPAFLAGPLANRLCRTDLQRRAAESGVTIMPDLGHRYTPATSRLRELIATRLGRPLAIDVVAAPGGQACFDNPDLQAVARNLFAAALDWCISLVGTPPLAVVPAGQTGSAGLTTAAHRYDVEFRRPSAGGDAARATIQVHAEPLPAGSANGAATGRILRQVKIRCATGAAMLEPPHGITWTSEAGDRQVS